MRIHSGHSQSLNYDIIFNTVDVKVIPDDAFKECTASLIIDLSSKGGLTFQPLRGAALRR